MEGRDTISEETFIQIFSEMITIARRSLSLAIDKWEGIRKELSALDLTLDNKENDVKLPISTREIINEIRASHSPIPLNVLSSQDAPTQQMDFRSFSLEDLFRTFTIAFVVLYSPSSEETFDSFMIVRILRMANSLSFGFHNGRRIAFIKLMAERSRDLRMHINDFQDRGKFFSVENWDRVGHDEILRCIIAHRPPLESVAKQISSSQRQLGKFFPNTSTSAILFFLRSILTIDSPPWCSGWQIPWGYEDSEMYHPSPSTSEE